MTYSTKHRDSLCVDVIHQIDKKYIVMKLEIQRNDVIFSSYYIHGGLCVVDFSAQENARDFIICDVTIILVWKKEDNMKTF